VLTDTSVFLIFTQPRTGSHDQENFHIEKIEIHHLQEVKNGIVTKNKVASSPEPVGYRQAVAIGLAQAGADVALPAGNFPTWKSSRRDKEDREKMPCRTDHVVSWRKSTISSRNPGEFGRIDILVTTLPQILHVCRY